jgi:hypothetical protein
LRRPGLLNRQPHGTGPAAAGTDGVVADPSCNRQDGERRRRDECCVAAYAAFDSFFAKMTTPIDSVRTRMIGFAVLFAKSAQLIRLV